MGAGTALINDLIIIQTVQGLCKYLFKVLGEEETRKRGIAIGYDHRKRGSINSKNFALYTASVCLSKGIKVYLFDRIVATPLVPYCTDYYNCASGIMVTASHNPKDDNGFKVYWGNGCQIIPPHDAGISESILANLSPDQEYVIDEAKLKTQYENLCVNPFEVISTSYFKACSEKLCKFETDNKKSTLKVTYTAMHGVGTAFTKRSFESFGLPPFIPVEKQVDPDPEFPTVEYPNPEEGDGALQLAIQTAESNNSTLILANDPDADRLAVAERQADGKWYMFSGNEIGALLAHWQFSNYKGDIGKVAMVASTVSSKLIGAIAKKEGFLFEETLTGFKWLGNRSVELREQGYDVLFAFEQAIGFCVGDLVKDKDGVAAAAVFAEMANQLQLQGTNCHDHLRNCINETYGYFVSNDGYILSPDKAINNKIFEGIRNDGKYRDTVGKGEYKVTGIRDLLAPGYDSSTPDNKPKMPVGSGQMITFTFSNGIVLTLRMSGTEPKLKYYTEISAPNPVDAKNELDKFVEDAVKGDLLKLD